MQHCAEDLGHPTPTDEYVDFILFLGALPQVIFCRLHSPRPTSRSCLLTSKYLLHMSSTLSPPIFLMLVMLSKFPPKNILSLDNVSTDTYNERCSPHPATQLKQRYVRKYPPLFRELKLHRPARSWSWLKVVMPNAT